ncbi:hypothetical protein [Candidatus Nitrososphaera evergladensis]|nr:hypothetical protein [Candidatus Nitrososphaera evergladensis]
MAEEVFIFGVVTGVFAFLVGIVFAARARRYSQGYSSSSAVSAHGGSSSSSSHGE